MNILFFCEQQVMCKVPNLKSALFVTFASYYCFNLEYPSVAKMCFSFFKTIYWDIQIQVKNLAVVLVLCQILSVTFKIVNNLIIHLCVHCVL